MTPTPEAVTVESRWTPTGALLTIAMVVICTHAWTCVEKTCPHRRAWTEATFRDTTHVLKTTAAWPRTTMHAWTAETTMQMGTGRIARTCETGGRENFVGRSM